MLQKIRSENKITVTNQEKYNWIAYYIHPKTIEVIISYLFVQYLRD